jgi:hypothetical protein
MTQDYTAYLAEKFLKEFLGSAVDKRLAFDAWVDRRGLRSTSKRCLWNTVKALRRRPQVAQTSSGPRPARRPQE